MPSLSPTWTTREVHGTWRNPFTDLLETGTWEATLGQRIINTLSNGKKQIFRAGKIASGSLNTTEGLPSLSMTLPVVDDPDNLPQGGTITLKVTFGSSGEQFILSPSQDWPLGDESNGGGYDLANILNPTDVPVAPPVVVIGVPNGVAKLNAQGMVVNADGSLPAGSGGGGGGTTLTAYSQITALANYPLTFAPRIGTTGADAKAGDWLPTSADVADAGSIGRGLLTTPSAAAGRTILGAGTSSLVIGTTATTAKAGNYVPAWTEVSGKPTVIAAGSDAAAARLAIGFDNAARAAVGVGWMKWSTTTSTWWAWDPTSGGGSGAWVNGGARPSVPAGTCWYDCQNDPAAPYPTGAQAPLQPAGMAGDKILAHELSAFYGS